MNILFKLMKNMCCRISFNRREMCKQPFVLNLVQQVEYKLPTVRISMPQAKRCTTR